MSNYDSVTDFMGAEIQHGPYNDRIYLMKTPDNISGDFIDSLIAMAVENKYSKIFAKIRISQYKLFSDKGFFKEALIPNYYKDSDTVLFMGCFLDKVRMVDRKTEIYDEILELCSAREEQLPVLDNGFEIIKCSENHIPQLSSIYREIFSSYPFPVHEEKYIKKTMDENVDYFAVEHNDKLVAVSSAEKDIEHLNAEMTDFATIEQYRGKGFSQLLLLKMENMLEREGIKTLYTIARAVSPGMNITFSKLGYNYKGRLINNTQICGSLESMNVWSKSL